MAAPVGTVQKYVDPALAGTLYMAVSSAQTELSPVITETGDGAMTVTGNVPATPEHP